MAAGPAGEARGAGQSFGGDDLEAARALRAQRVGQGQVPLRQHRRAIRAQDTPLVPFELRHKSVA